MAKFIMLIGLPSSGKSTYAKRLLDANDNIKHFSSDRIREELYGDENTQGDSNKVFRIMHQRVKDALDKGCNVVYDATNVTRKSRRGILQQIKKYCDDIEAHVIWVPYDECVERDKLRKRTVGESVIRKFLYRWQSPFYDEGFTKIIIVHNESIKFDIEHYRNSIIDNMKIPHDNPHHRLSVWEHSEEARKYAVSKFVCTAVWEAAYLHDIGKPQTKSYKTDDEGKIIPVAHYYQHDAVGGYLVYGFYPTSDQRESIIVSWLISEHMQPYFDSKYYRSLNGNMKLWLDQVHEADEAAH